ncbi:MAG: hypothetical protein HZA78_11650 [Candidatus Schekmanbacteria bacterium]|nr:hypothetical protein [Candidatus Schekmanbacteria bacterium]
MRILGYSKLLKYLSTGGIFFSFGLLCIAGQAQAQELTAAQGGRWQIQPSLSFYQQYSDNIDLAYRNPLGAWRTEIIPGVSFIRPLPRKQLKFDLNLKLDHREKENGVSETFSWYDIYGYAGHEVSPRLSYELSGNLNAGYTENNIGKPFINVFSSVNRSVGLTFSPGLKFQLTRTTLTKASYSYTLTQYAGSGAVNATEHTLSLYLEQKFGSRVVVDIGGIYSIKTLSNNAGYKDFMIPVGITMDLTYTKIRIGWIYLIRNFNQQSGLQNTNKLGFQVAAELGGTLLRLRATTVELNYSTSYYQDLYGDPYENQEARLGVYHAFHDFDVYAYTRYGNNIYIQKQDKVNYYGAGTNVKYRISALSAVAVGLDYDNYNYTPAGRDYTITRGTIDYTYYLYEWILTGVSYRRTTSTSSTIEGNYTENLYALFVRAVW